MSEPSQAARSASVRNLAGMRVENDEPTTVDRVAAMVVLTAAHDLALGLDRSVCLRDVVEALHRGPHGHPTRHEFADWLEREFGARP